MHCREHADELVQALGKQLKPQEDSPLIHLKRLQGTHAANRRLCEHVVCMALSTQGFQAPHSGSTDAWWLKALRLMPACRQHTGLCKKTLDSRPTFSWLSSFMASLRLMYCCLYASHSLTHSCTWRSAEQAYRYGEQVGSQAVRAAVRTSKQHIPVATLHGLPCRPAANSAMLLVGLLA